MNKARQRNRTKAEREAILEEFIESGLTQREFCEERGILVGTFQYWLRRTREVEEAMEVQAHEGSAALMEVKFAADGGLFGSGDGIWRKAEYEVVLREGKRLVVRGGFAASEVAALIAILEAR